MQFITVFLTEMRLLGGEEAQTKEAAGGILAERRPIAMNVATVMIVAVIVVAIVTETAGMIVSSEPHPEIRRRVSRARFRLFF